MRQGQEGCRRFGSVREGQGLMEGMVRESSGGVGKGVVDHVGRDKEVAWG